MLKNFHASFGLIFRIFLILLAFAPVWIAAPAISADDDEDVYNGRYVADGESRPVYLTLKTENGNLVTGSLIGNGQQYTLRGNIKDGLLMGTLEGATGQLFFEAKIDHGQVNFTLFGRDARGGPNYRSSKEMVFFNPDQPVLDRRRIGAQLSGRARFAQQPLAQNAIDFNDPFNGTFAGGNMVLQLSGGSGTYSGSVKIRGQVYAVQFHGGGGALQGYFVAGGRKFPVNLNLVAGAVTLHAEKSTYRLKRVAASIDGLTAGLQGRLSPLQPRWQAGQSNQQIGARRLAGQVVVQRPQPLNRQAYRQRNLLSSNSPLGQGDAPPPTSRYGQLHLPNSNEAAFVPGTQPKTLPGNPPVARIIRGGQRHNSVSAARLAAAGAGFELDDGTKVGQSWSQWLAGKRLSVLAGDNGGGAGDYSDQIDVLLCRDGRFGTRFGGKLSISTGGNDRTRGNWRIFTRGPQAGAILTFADGRQEVYELSRRNGETFANGERIYVTPGTC